MYDNFFMNERFFVKNKNIKEVKTLKWTRGNYFIDFVFFLIVVKCNKKFYKKTIVLWKRCIFLRCETWMKHGGIFLGERIKKIKIVLYVIMHLEVNFVLNFWFINVYVNHVNERKLFVVFVHNIHVILFICVIVGNIVNVI